MRSHKTIKRFLLLWSFCAIAAFAQGPLTFSPQTFPSLVVGQRSVLPFEVNGGTAPYTLSLTSGQIPAGFMFNPNNPIQLIGTSTAAGTFTFTLLATDSSTPAQTASQTFTVTATVQPLVLLPTGNLSGGVVGAAYPSSVYAQGGIPPYNWSIKYGTLPASSGLTLNPTTSGQNAQGLPGQAITGTPQTAGTYSFTLQVTDSSPTPITVSQTYSLSVINPVSYLDPISHPAPPAIGQTTGPTGITATSGTNAALWFTQQGYPISGSVIVHGIESLTTGGVFQHQTELPVYPSVTPFPQAITAGPDGNLWVTDQSSNYLYTVKPDGSSVTPITLQTAGVPPDPVTPTGITSGNEGGVWFTGQGSTQIGYIGRVTPGSNALNFFQVPAPISNPVSIVQDPADSNHFWFLAQAGPVSSPTVVIGRINPSNGAFEVPSGCQAFNQSIGFAGFAGCIIEYADGTLVAPDSSVVGQSIVGPLIVVGSDGAIWFATANGLGRITTDGTSVSFYPTSTGIQSMTLGSDNAIWFTETPLGSNLARISPSGQITTFNIPSQNPGLDGVTVGPDGAIWIADNANNAVLQVFPSLALNCTVPGNLEVGVPIVNASCTAFGGKGPYTYTFDQSNLPPGVTVDANGVLSGTPTAPGSFTITAHDSGSPAQQASQVFSIQAAPTIQLVCNFPATATAGQPYSGSCLTAGGTPPYTYAAPNLLAGLTGTAVNNSTTGDYEYDVSGTLSQNAHGTVTFTITATDSTTPTGNSSAPHSITVAITPLPAAIACNANTQAIVGKPFQQTCFGLLGTPPYTFAATGLPAGLTINPASGVISGTPAAVGPSAVSVVLTDTAGQTATQAITLTVINPKLALVCDFSALATQGTAYSTTCNTSGGTAPYSYSLLSGALPAGLNLDPSSGAVTGTPTIGGYVSFTLQVTDASALVAQQSVAFLVTPTALTILSTTLPAPNASLPYAVDVLTAGGTPPYTYSISSGALPAGLQLDPNVGAITPLAGGTLATGPYSFTVQVTDAATATATQTYAGTILAPLVQNFTSFAIPGTSGANGITVGPDGALWFTTLDQSGGNLLGRITTAGVITTTPAANPLAMNNVAAGELPAGGDITTGPDGELWAAQRDGNSIAELAVDLSSQLSYLPTTASSGPAQLTSAPDGAVWFTEAAASQIARVDSAGNFTEFATPTPSSFPTGIVLGPKNLLIFTEPIAGRIGFISEDGTTKVDFPTPTSGSLPLSIVMGPDNALWFTEYGAKKIGRVDFAGNIQEVPVSSNPVGITLGPDGALYFTEPNANVIGRITIFGSVIEIPISDADSGATGIVTGPDGSIWFTESNLSKIARLSFILAPTVSCTLPAGTLSAGAPFSGSCTGSQGTAPYLFSTSGNLPPGVSINPTTGALSGTLTTAGTFTFNVILTDSSSPPQVAQQSYTFTVTPLPLSLSCNTPTARLYTSYLGTPSTAGGTAPAYGCTALNGTPPYTYALSAGTLPPGLSINASTGVISGTPTTLGDYPVTVQVTDSSTPPPPMVASQSFTISVQYGTITGRGTPLFTLSTPPTSVTPGAQTQGLTLTVNEPLLQATSVTAVLTFKLASLIPTSGVLGQTYTTPADYTDPAMQFVDASGNALTATYNFTIPPGVTSITLPAINPGTVLGTITLTITAAGLPQTATSFPVSGLQPTIEAGSVQFTNVTTSGFDIEFVATAPTRTANYVTITFNAASGSTISGQQMFVLDVSNATNEWFASADGLKYGGRYSLTIPFQFNGPVSAISSATVMLSIGTENSAPVTGNR